MSLIKRHRSIKGKFKNLLVKLSALIIAASSTVGLAACSNEDLTPYEQSLADKVIETINLDEEVDFSNAKFRNISAEKAEEKYDYSVYIVAQKDETPYFVKADLTLSEYKDYSEAIKYLSTCIDDYRIKYQITETTSDIISILNDMTYTQTAMSKPDEYTFDYGVINGYFVQGDSITFDISVATHKTTSYTTMIPIYTGSGMALISQVHTDTNRYYTNNYVSVEKTDDTNINDFVLNYLNNIDDYYIKIQSIENKITSAKTDGLDYNLVNDNEINNSNEQ